MSEVVFPPTPFIHQSNEQPLDRTNYYLLDYVHVGCYIDKLEPNRAITGGYNARTAEQNVIKDCYEKASSLGYEYFAIQASTQCMTSATAGTTYMKHGPSSDCRHGKGGPWLNDVYRIATQV